MTPAAAPDLLELELELKCLLGVEVTVIQEVRHDYASTYPVQVVRAVVGGRDSLLFCKRGTDYESRVYAEIVCPADLGPPRFVGATSSLLVLEYLNEAVRLSKAPNTEANMLQAARWIARFHRRAQSRSFLRRLDAAYYLQWPEIIQRDPGSVHRRYPRVARVCSLFPTVVDLLLRAPQTVIHGEYYSENVLISDGVVCPIDWETAALGAGELDVASLAEDWGDSMEEMCEAEYLRARWNDSSPPDAARVFDAARLHWGLRWAAENIRSGDEVEDYYAELIELAGERLGLLR